ncbi:MAG: hypothetical protein IK079_01515, partial [Desulfovibrio sp.]|nr:hypothetical protein [Desulfovibrio sp.]
ASRICTEIRSCARGPLMRPPALSDSVRGIYQPLPPAGTPKSISNIPWQTAAQACSVRNVRKKPECVLNLTATQFGRSILFPFGGSSPKGTG